MPKASVTAKTTTEISLRKSISKTTNLLITFNAAKTAKHQSGKITYKPAGQTRIEWANATYSVKALNRRADGKAHAFQTMSQGMTKRG